MRYARGRAADFHVTVTRCAPARCTRVFSTARTSKDELKKGQRLVLHGKVERRSLPSRPPGNGEPAASS